jgi:hypothetical protein
MFSPVGSGHTVRKLVNVVKLDKLVGPHYNQQDEYSGTLSPSAAEPATLIYWQFGAAANAAFTVTTGGLFVSVRVVQDVEYFEPERDNTIARTFRCKTISDCDLAIKQLKAIREDLEPRLPSSMY